MRNSHKMACWKGGGGGKWHVIFFFPPFVQNQMRKRFDLHNTVANARHIIRILLKELTFGRFVCLFSVPGVAIRADDR